MSQSLFLKALCQGSEGASRDEIRAVLAGGTPGEGVDAGLPLPSAALPIGYGVLHLHSKSMVTESAF